MAKRELFNPLRSKAARPAREKGPPIVAPVAISVGLVLAVVSTLWVAVVDDPGGGRAEAVAMIKEAPAVTGSVSHDALVPGQVAPPAEQLELAALPAMPAASGLPGLLEQSAFGPLPRVSPDGRRPREAYAGRASPAGEGAPRVVLVVGGLGISQTGTQKAIDILPENVTLAFAPYGSSLQRWVDRARGEGHEVLLQVPLEPVGYPEENPGEHTLLVSNDRMVGQRDLEWVLSRMTAYAGVMNYMGGRFTSDERALAPFLGEIGHRGLFYLDDGSSPESRAAAVGANLAVPVVTADLVLDRQRGEASIERELASLEAIARSRGLAVGVASAFPASVEALAGWARDAGERGIAVVPASAALAP
jgi:polysaccharide deacetylase 2 family uncharacterized protein YibQ